MYWKRNRLALRVLRGWDTLAFRLTAGYALAGLLLLLLVSLGLYLVLVSELNKSTEEFLADKINVVRAMLREQPADPDGLHEEVELESAVRHYEPFYIRLVNGRGKPMLTTPHMDHELDLRTMDALLAVHRGVASATTGTNGKAFRIMAADVPSSVAPDGLVTIQVAVDVSRKEALLRRFRMSFWISFGVMLLLFPLVGYRIARQGIRPVEEIAATARRITSTHLEERIVAEGYPYELASLALTFNRMLDGLQDAFSRISRFSADIAHDLRTPVNNIRGEAEVALARGRSVGEYRDALESTHEEAVRLSDLISNLLFLARTEHPYPHLQLEHIDLCELLESVREYYDVSASEAGVNLVRTPAPGPVFADLDRTLIQRALGNLIANAVAHTPQGGTVTIKAYPDAARVVLVVSDTGTGIPPEALPYVFERFYRVDPSRSRTSGGTGLGLSIVQGIMHLHRGTVEIGSTHGAGTQVVLSLPVRLGPLNV